MSPDEQRHEELAKKVAQDRVQLGQALKGLRRTAKHRAAMETQMNERPWLFIMAGFAFGFWLGSRVSR